ncbi:potassium/sodium eff [Auricularia subglabra TFB-10046 SS5]|nr:potassium/sodium eff [Auricularia subglabra TFB-10046 SS5]
MIVTQNGGAPPPPHTVPSETILAQLDVDPHWGLADDQAKERLAQNGPNRLKPPKKPSRLKILLAQVLNAMTIVLIGAMLVSLGTLDWIAAGVIGLLVFINVSVGYSQEWKAEKTLAALESVGSPQATVVRHDPADRRKTRGEPHILVIPTEEVVAGDIVLVKIGDVVPADARIIEGHISNLECDEALLTGESLPVAKVAHSLDDPKCPVGDRINMVYSGSQVTKGRARAVVTMTGMSTELGKIAQALESQQKSNKKGWARFVQRVRLALGIEGTTPLQIKLNKLAYLLLFIAIVLAIIVVSSTGYREIPDSIATYAVAAAVSLLPASLIAVVSLTLAVACRELAARNALVRRMDAVETLGGVHDICSDKTGTITVGRMVVKQVWTPATTTVVSPGTRAPYDTARGQLYVVESGRDPYYPRGTIRAINEESLERADIYGEESEDDLTADDIVRIDNQEPSFQDLVQSASLNNMATLRRGDEAKGWEANGDPTEIALQVFAHKAGHGKPHLTQARRKANQLLQPLHPVVSRASANVVARAEANKLQRVKTAESDVPRAAIDGHYEMLVEHPFDSTIKRMSTVWQFVPQDEHEEPTAYDLIAYMKGAVERILDRCTHVGLGDARLEITQDDKDNIILRMNTLAAEGLRVLCLAGKFIPNCDKDDIKTQNRDVLESGFGFLGLAGIYDPPRPESAGAVMDAHRAGIVPRMLTGDHPATATSIARKVGILTDEHGSSACMTGQQLDSMTEEEIDALPELPVVVARCSPETKVRMVDALSRRGRKAVMTGDGVNDSPALKRAAVGVAMGLNGSDVAKGAADIVLADDNFSTIVRAIRKGRSVFQNLAKFLVYLLSGNVAEVVVIILGLTVRREGIAIYPIGPVAALWINTIAAGPPALALGVEPTSKDAMDIGPERFQGIFTAEWYADTIGYGVIMGGQALANFFIVQYGVAEGVQDIYATCNEALGGMPPECRVVYKARGTAFATLQLILMIHGITCKNLNKSIFQMRLLENTMLLWSVGCLALSVFPIIYIPEVNHRVFQVDGLSWHWGLVFGQLILYLVLAELYKLARRTYRRRQARITNAGYEKEKCAGYKLHVAYTTEPKNGTAAV